MSKVVILENVRSAYNVWNIIRTADALGWEVWIVGYTPSPLEHPKVQKTSLGAESNVGLQQFDFTADAIAQAKKGWMKIIAAEITPEAILLSDFSHSGANNIAVVFGNEIEGVLATTLEQVDEVVAIPMQGLKESLNIGQSVAIFMRELGKG